MFKWNFTAVNFFHGTLGAVGTDVLGGPQSKRLQNPYG